MSTSMARHHLSSPTAGETATVNVKHYGAVGNGLVDDTVALQTALNVFGRVSGRSGVLIIPNGAYKITDTLTYEGAPSLSIRIVGDMGATKGPRGTRIVWAGAAGGTMMYMLGLNGSVLENFDLQGAAAQPLIGLHLDAYNVTGPPDTSSAVNVLRRIGISGMVGVDSTGLALGHPAEESDQVSELEMYDLLLVGGGAAGDAYYGIKTYQAGNTKNFKLTGGLIAGWRYGIDWLQASGVFGVHGTSFTWAYLADVRMGSGNMHIDTVESECQNARFVVGSTGSNQGSLVVTNCSWQGSTPADDYIIDYSGHILLQGNTFYNYRDGTSYPKIKLNGEPLMSSTVSAAGLTSIGNWYRRAPTGSAPFFDWADNKLLSASGVYAGANVSVTSLGDYGGIGGSIQKLENWIPRDAAMRA